MRSGVELKRLILEIASKDRRIRSVLLNGSRVNSNITPDKYQDFDIVFIVTELAGFTSNHEWVNLFGEIIIWQLPDEMANVMADPDVFRYLMIFDDGNRIDLTLYQIDKVEKNYWPDSLTICLLDKDNLFDGLLLPNESDYFIKQPSEKEFKDTCNEFWWVSTYVAKGLLRNEITYAKEMLETIVRPMFMKLIEWKIGIENDFSVSFGKAGRFMYRYLSNEYYTKVLHTYSDFNIENNWQALFTMIELFVQTSIEVSTQLKFQINKREQQNSIHYLRQLYVEQKNYHPPSI